MSKELQQHHYIVDLADGVFTRTSLPSDSHAALRAGFAGYPSNPRWSASKFRAWKTGRQWRKALANQEMVIRSSDSMLIPAIAEAEDSPQIASISQRFPLKTWVKQLWTSYQTAGESA
ncbi:MAG: hypothetical protein ACOC0N_05300 [Chroococcales cyanobacterium]